MKKLLLLFVLISSCSTSTEKPFQDQPQKFYRVVQRIEKHLNGEVFGIHT